MTGVGEPRAAGLRRQRGRPDAAPGVALRFHVPAPAPLRGGGAARRRGGRPGPGRDLRRHLEPGGGVRPFHVASSPPSPAIPPSPWSRRACCARRARRSAGARSSGSTSRRASSTGSSPRGRARPGSSSRPTRSRSRCSSATCRASPRAPREMEPHDVFVAAEPLLQPHDRGRPGARRHRRRSHRRPPDGGLPARRSPSRTTRRGRRGRPSACVTSSLASTRAVRGRRWASGSACTRDGRWRATWAT